MKKILWGMICVAFITASNNAAAQKPKGTQASEFADPKYMEMGKKQLMQMEKADMDGWINNFADTAVFAWSGGDSLAGKNAIGQYWRERRMNVVDSVHFTNAIWLPMKVNQPQSVETPGIWLLSWYQVNVKYKNGKNLSFWVHNVMHYNSADKIDWVMQYIDRAPVNAALGK